MDRLESKGATFVRGWARARGPPDRRRWATQSFEARRAIVLNPGTRAWAPPIDGLADTPYWTNRDAIETESVPERLIVIGGGAIGLELGQVFLRFGSAVTTLETAPRLLALEEPESSELITTVLSDEGMTRAHRRDHQRRSATTGPRFTVSVDGVGERHGRAPAGRDRAAPRPRGTGGRRDRSRRARRRSIPVDDRMRAADGVWAIGDVTGEGAFTHVSMYQAAIAVDDILGRPGPAADYRALPRVTFTDPEVGSVGLTEAQARQAAGQRGGRDQRRGHARRGAGSTRPATPG